MKRLVATLLVVAFLAVSALAFAGDMVTLENKKGAVTFNHKAHGEREGCKACHEGEPAKIELDMKSGHALCKDCHKTKGAGPTACNDCHKK